MLFFCSTPDLCFVGDSSLSDVGNLCLDTLTGNQLVHFPDLSASAGRDGEGSFQRLPGPPQERTSYS